MCETHLKVLEGELQHVSEDIAEDLRLPLHQHIFVVQRLDHLWFDLENADTIKRCEKTEEALEDGFSRVQRSDTAGKLLT